MEEWLDIVDNEDRVVGRDTRYRVHQRNELHRAAHIVLFNPAGEVFVQQRSLSKDSGAGLWDTSVAGHLDSGETYLHCAVRELLEEVGVRIAPEQLRWLGKLPPEARNGFEFTGMYLACTEQELVLDPDEIDDGKWLMPDQLDRWISESPSQFTEVFRMIWPLVKAHQFG